MGVFSQCKKIEVRGGPKTKAKELNVVESCKERMTKGLNYQGEGKKTVSRKITCASEQE